MGQSIAMKQAQAEPIATTLEDLATPCLVLDAERMERNIARLKAKLDGRAVTLRPHLKTCKSVDVARRVMTSPEAEALRECAEVERRSVVDAATILREADLPCPVVSVGSTPTAHNATEWSRFGGWR